MINTFYVAASALDGEGFSYVMTCFAAVCLVFAVVSIALLWRDRGR